MNLERKCGKEGGKGREGGQVAAVECGAFIAYLGIYLIRRCVILD
jgi:hypothetical protein